MSESSIIQNSDSAEKEALIRRLEQKRKELLTKLKAKKQKLEQFYIGMENYRHTIYTAVEKARTQIRQLQSELKLLFADLRKAKLLNSAEKKVLRDMEMTLIGPEQKTDPPKEKNNKEEEEKNRESNQSWHTEDVISDAEAPKVENRHLRKIYLRLAAMYHPDKAVDEVLAEQLHELMLQINAAYKSGDIAALLELEHKYKNYKHIRIGSHGASAVLSRKIEQIRQETDLLQEQFDRIKRDIAEAEKSDLGRMYKDFIKLKKMHHEPVKLITRDLTGTVEYMSGLKESIREFLETGVMPAELEREFYPEEFFELDAFDSMEFMFEEDEKTASKKRRSR